MKAYVPIQRESRRLPTPTKIAIVVMMSAAFGLIRDVLLASRLGLNILTDTLFLAMTIPAAFENIIGIALRDAIIQRMAAADYSVSESSPTIEARLRRRLGALSIGIMVTLGAISPWIARMITPGWTTTEREIATIPIAVGCLLVGVQTWTYFQAALFNVRRDFLFPNLRMLAANVGVILGAIMFPSSASMIVGMLVLSTLAFAVISELRLRRASEELPVSATPQLEGQAGVGIRRLMVPLIAVAVLQQAVVLAERWFATFLPEGSIAQLTLAFRIVTIPVTVVAVSIVAIRFPSMIVASSRNDAAVLRGHHDWMMTASMLLVLAFAAFVIVDPIVLARMVLWQRGASLDEVQSFAGLLVGYSLGVPGMTIALLWSRLLLVRGKFRTFVWVTAAGSVLTLAMDAFLVRSFGAFGLAISFSAGTWLQAILAGLANRAVIAGWGMTISRWLLWMVLAAFVVRQIPKAGVEILDVAWTFTISTVLVVLLFLMSGDAGRVWRILEIPGSCPVFRRKP